MRVGRHSFFCPDISTTFRQRSVSVGEHRAEFFALPVIGWRPTADRCLIVGSGKRGVDLRLRRPTISAGVSWGTPTP